MQEEFTNYKNFFLKENFVILENEKVLYDLVFDQDWEFFLILINSEIEMSIKILSKNLKISCLTIWENDTSNKVNIKWIIENSSTKLNIFLWNLMFDNSSVVIDWDIEITKNIKNISGHLMEETIILWKNTKVSTKPLLHIDSNEIEASHWAKIEKISTEKKFYLKSKWLSEKSANKLIVGGYIDSFFGKSLTKNDEIKKIRTRILEKL